MTHLISVIECNFFDSKMYFYELLNGLEINTNRVLNPVRVQFNQKKMTHLIYVIDWTFFDSKMFFYELLNGLEINSDWVPNPVRVNNDEK